MKKYYRVILGRNNDFAARCLAENFIGVGYGMDRDLSGMLTDDWRLFNKRVAPLFLAERPDKTRIAAGLACGVLWTMAKGIREGDIVLCPDGAGEYRFGEVTGGYAYHHGDKVHHQRAVRWLSQTVERDELSDELWATIRARNTICDLSKHSPEIERLLAGQHPTEPPPEPGVENPAMFALEKHLEDFLLQNWGQTELGKEFAIFEEEGECVGQQYPTDTGPIDILAVSKDKKQLLVIELKKGRASDVVVGQTLRYMGYVKDELAEDGQSVQGAIIALEDDQRIRRALAAVPNIAFYRYQISFRLVKA